MLKKTDKIVKINYISIASGRISGSNRPARQGKKKREYDKNSVSLGFEVGFTKKLIVTLGTKHFFKNKAGKRFQVITEIPRDKKKKKKIVKDTKKLQDKKLALKKKQQDELKRMESQKTKKFLKKTN
jgi:hypothetical protein